MVSKVNVSGVEAVSGAATVEGFPGAWELGAGWRFGPGGDGERRSVYPVVKFCGEWVSALVLLLVASPLALVLALLIKLTSRGPAIYAQTRLGMGGRTYRIFKLRTMVHDAERATGAVWAGKNDSRITKLGAFLRLTHLDELPQLINVLRGEMSLIGPRPERPEMARKIERRVPGFHRRLAVRPGITGLAQMLLPADDPQDEEMECVRAKLAQDLVYIRRMGFVLDLRVALCTPLYFLVAALDAVRVALVKPYGVRSEATKAPAAPRSSGAPVLHLELRPAAPAVASRERIDGVCCGS